MNQIPICNHGNKIKNCCLQCPGDGCQNVVVHFLHGEAMMAKKRSRDAVRNPDKTRRGTTLSKPRKKCMQLLRLWDGIWPYFFFLTGIPRSVFYLPLFAELCTSVLQPFSTRPSYIRNTLRCTSYLRSQMRRRTSLGTISCIVTFPVHLHRPDLFMSPSPARRGRDSPVTETDGTGLGT